MTLERGRRSLRVVRALLQYERTRRPWNLRPHRARESRVRGSAVPRVPAGPALGRRALGAGLRRLRFRAAGGPGASATGRRPAVADLVHAYRELGHLVADLDPLDRARAAHPLLRARASSALTDGDLDRVVDAGAVPRRSATARCASWSPRCARPTAARWASSTSPSRDKAQREWLQERMEPSRNRPELTPEDRRALLERLIAAEAFEHFLHTQLRRPEALLAGRRRGADPAARHARRGGGARRRARRSCMGMPHRGRLNVLAHVMGKPYELILAEFEGTLPAVGRSRATATSSITSATPTTASRRDGRPHPPLDEPQSEPPGGWSTRSWRASCAPSRAIAATDHGRASCRAAARRRRVHRARARSTRR